MRISNPVRAYQPQNRAGAFPLPPPQLTAPCFFAVFAPAALPILQSAFCCGAAERRFPLPSLDGRTETQPQYIFALDIVDK